MLGALFLAGASFYLFRLLGGAPQLRLRRVEQGQATAAKIEELTEYASRMRQAKKYSTAEKVYLQILKLDHRHAATYSRLGTLYSLQQNRADAIECFELATQLSPSGSTYYNLGLGYFENANFIKAIAAFEKANMFEPTAARYIGLAKTYQKTGDQTKVISALEQARQLEETSRVLWLLADAYHAAGRDEEAQQAIKQVGKIDPRNERLRALKKRAKMSASTG